MTTFRRLTATLQAAKRLRRDGRHVLLLERSEGGQIGHVSFAGAYSAPLARHGDFEKLQIRVRSVVIAE